MGAARAMSMARLWRDQGNDRRLTILLAPVSSWFTEGFDMLGLKEAKAPVDELVLALVVVRKPKVEGLLLVHPGHIPPRADRRLAEIAPHKSYIAMQRQNPIYTNPNLNCLIPNLSCEP